MIERYTHLSPAHKAAAVERIGEVGREALAAFPTRSAKA
jgi:hypothetical protein